MVGLAHTAVSHMSTAATLCLDMIERKWKSTRHRTHSGIHQWVVGRLPALCDKWHR